MEPSLVSVVTVPRDPSITLGSVWGLSLAPLSGATVMEPSAASPPLVGSSTREFRGDAQAPTTRINSPHTKWAPRRAQFMGRNLQVHRRRSKRAPGVKGWTCHSASVGQRPHMVVKIRFFSDRRRT